MQQRQLLGVLVSILLGGSISLVAEPVAAQVESDRKAEADRLLNLCRENLTSEDFEAALNSCQDALTAYQQLQDVGGQARSMTNVGIAQNSLEQHEEAVATLQSALPLASSLSTKQVEAIVFNNLAIAYEALGQPQEAENLRQQASLFFQAEELLQQGIQQNQISQFREALQSWEQALEIYRAIGDRAGEGAALGNLGIVYKNLGQYPRAIELYEQQLVITREIGDRSGEGATLGNL